MRFISILLIVSLFNVQCSFSSEQEGTNFCIPKCFRRKTNQVITVNQENVGPQLKFKEVASLNIDNLMGIECAIYSIAWSKNGTLLCYIHTTGNDNQLIEIDPSTSEICQTFFLDNKEYCPKYKILLSSDENKVHLNTKDGCKDLLIYDFESKTLLNGFKNFTPNNNKMLEGLIECINPITAFAWSLHGVFAAVGKRLLLYNVDSKAILKEFEIKIEDIYSKKLGKFTIILLSRSPDDTKLLFCLADWRNSVGLLDINTGEYEILYEHSAEFDTGPRVNQIVWLSDTVFAACSNYKIVFWDTEHKQELKTFPIQASLNNHFMVDGISASFASDTNPLTFLSPDGKMLALLHSSTRGLGPNLFSIIDVENNKHIAEQLGVSMPFRTKFEEEFYGPFAADLTCLQWSHDNNFFVAVGCFKNIKVWEKVIE